jgi:hypothetical protein
LVGWSSQPRPRVRSWTCDMGIIIRLHRSAKIANEVMREIGGPDEHPDYAVLLDADRAAVRPREHP